MSELQSASLHRRRFAAGLYVVPVTALTLVVVVASLGWIGTTFPGFFVMANRVVPSIGLAHWSVMQRTPSLYQHQILAVDGVSVTTAADVYRAVAALPPGERRYDVLSDGAVEPRTLASQVFTAGDWVSIFGALLLNGLIFTGVGVLVGILGPPVPATVGTIVVMLDLGLFCLTALDLYGPARFFRLHVTTEALFIPTLLHLALVFPVVRLGRFRRPVLAAGYGLSALLVAAYQWWLYDPAAYSRIHNLCMAGAGVVGAGLIVSGVQAYLTSSSMLVRRRLGVTALGMLTGFAIPAWLLTVSGVLGGEAAINVSTFTAFLFPLSLAYAVLKHDLFEIDAMLRRATSYLLLTAVVASAYAATAFVVGAALQTVNAAQSALFPLLFGIAMVFMLIPLRDRIQRVVDRLYHRTSHDAQRTLQRSSGALVATLDLDDISTLTVEIVCQSLLVSDASLWLRDADGGFVVAHTAGAAPALRGPLTGTHPLIAHLATGVRAITIYDRDDAETPTWDERRRARALRDLHAELILPLGAGDPAGFLAIGQKESGRMFTLDDIGFLTTFANQVAIAVANARSYRQVEALNVSLEHKVEQRTRELAVANEELGASLSARERAYRELQQSQESLVRAEKMATVGRLAAGIAHEVNTPLGATLNSLKTLEELVEEYAASIGDPSVTPDDHRAIAGDFATIVRNLTSWTNKAAGYIRSVKAHTRSLETSDDRVFDLAQLIADTQLLLVHQFRLAACTLTVDCPAGVLLYGDPGKLGQILTNLLTNAIDAYEGRGHDEGRIVLRAESRDEAVALVVEDAGSGIAPEHLERIFDELFTTKPSGRGTGLGLSIARALAANCFGGRIEAASELGCGSRFTVILPRRDVPAVARAASA